MEDKLEKFDMEVNNEVEKLINYLGFKIKENMTAVDWWNLDKELETKGYKLTTEEFQEENTYKVNVNLTISLKLNLGD